MKRTTKPTHSLSLFILTLLVTLFASLACSVDFGGESNDDVAIQQTIVALQQTQIALDNAVAPGSGDQPVDESGENPPPPQVEEEPAPQPDVSYEGVSFSYDPNIAQGVVPATIPGQNMGNDYMPGDTYPTHTEFSFNHYAIADHFHTPVIRVYPVDEFRAMSTAAAGTIDALQQALINRPSGGANSNLPFLPIWNAAQVFTAQVGYFDFQNGSGVRFLTMYGQAIYPVDNQNLFYTYQGLTHDGRYYISAVLPVTHMGLPNDGSTQVDDWMAFENNWQTYISDTITWLEGQESQAFFPSLEALDAMMASFRIDR